MPEGGSQTVPSVPYDGLHSCAQGGPGLCAHMPEHLINKYLLMGRIYWMRALAAFCWALEQAACCVLAQSHESSVFWPHVGASLIAVAWGRSLASLGLSDLIFHLGVG